MMNNSTTSIAALTNSIEGYKSRTNFFLYTFRINLSTDMNNNMIDKITLASEIYLFLKREYLNDQDPLLSGRLLNQLVK